MPDDHARETTPDRGDLPDAYTPEEVRAMLYSAMAEYYSLCPAESMTPAELGEMTETMRRNAGRERR